MSKESYIAGFTKVAEAHGIDPAALMKIAQATTKGTGPRLGGSALTSEQALGQMKANAEPLSLWKKLWGGRPYAGSIDFHNNDPHLDALANQPKAVSEEAARLAAQGKNSVPIPNTGHPLGRTAIDSPGVAKGIIGRNPGLFEAIKARKLPKNPLGTTGLGPEKPIIKELPKMINPWIKRIGSILKKAR